MKKAIHFGNSYLISLLFVFILFSGFMVGSSNRESILVERPLTENLISGNNQLKHLLLFNFNETATPEKITKIVDELISLQKKIPEIKNIESGLNNFSNGKSKGFTHCFIMTFESEEDLAIYIAHPEHKSFGKILHPQLDDFLVFDYWTNN